MRGLFWERGAWSDERAAVYFSLTCRFAGFYEGGGPMSLNRRLAT